MGWRVEAESILAEVVTRLEHQAEAWRKRGHMSAWHAYSELLRKLAWLRKTITEGRDVVG